MTLKKLNKLLGFIYPLVSVGILLVLFTVLHYQYGSEYIFPSLSAVLGEMGEYLSDIFFWKSLAETLSRTVISFLVSLFLALVTGILSYLFNPVKRILTPFIGIMRSAPTIAVMIILNLLLVKPTLSPVLVSITVVFPMLFSSVLAAFNNVDLKLVEMAKLYKVPLSKRIFSLYVPSVFPYILAECGSAISFNVKLVVSAEIIAYTYNSLGGILQTQYAYLEIASVMALTILTVIVALILEFIVWLVVFFIKKRRHAK